MGALDDLISSKQPSSSGGELDKLIASHSSQPPQNALTDTAQDVIAGALRIPAGLTGIADIVPSAFGLNRPVDKFTDYIGEKTGFQPSKLADSIQANNYSPERVAANQRMNKTWQDYEDNNIGLGEALKQTVTNPRAALGNVAASMPSMFAGGAIGKAAKGLGLASEALAPAVGEGAIMAGQQMDNIDNNADPQKAALLSAITGIGGAALSRLGGKAAEKMGLVDPDVALTNGLAAAARQPMGLPARLAGGFVSEGALEELPQSLLEQGAQNIAEDKPLTQGMARAGVEGTLAGGLMGAGFNALPQQQPEQPPPPQWQTPDYEYRGEGIAGPHMQLEEHSAREQPKLPSPALGLGVPPQRGNIAPDTQITFDDGSTTSAYDYFDQKLAEHGDENLARQQTFEALVGKPQPNTMRYLPDSGIIFSPPETKLSPLTGEELPPDIQESGTIGAALDAGAIVQPGVTNSPFSQNVNEIPTQEESLSIAGLQPTQDAVSSQFDSPLITETSNANDTRRTDAKNDIATASQDIGTRSGVESVTGLGGDGGGRVADGGTIRDDGQLSGDGDAGNLVDSGALILSLTKPQYIAEQKKAFVKENPKAIPEVKKQFFNNLEANYDADYQAALAAKEQPNAPSQPVTDIADVNGQESNAGFVSGQGGVLSENSAIPLDTRTDTSRNAAPLGDVEAPAAVSAQEVTNGSLKDNFLITRFKRQQDSSNSDKADKGLSAEDVAQLEAGKLFKTKTLDIPSTNYGATSKKLITPRQFVHNNVNVNTEFGLEGKSYWLKNNGDKQPISRLVYDYGSAYKAELRKAQTGINQEQNNAQENPVQLAPKIEDISNAKTIDDTNSKFDLQKLGDVTTKPMQKNNIYLADHSIQLSSEVPYVSPDKKPKTNSLIAKLAAMIPTFQGGKTKMARAVTEKINTFFDGDAQKITIIDDWFGGSGGWGGYLASVSFSNTKLIRVHEFSPERLEKIKMFHLRGHEIEDVFNSKQMRTYIENLIKAVDDAGTFSGSGIRNRIDDAFNTKDARDALKQEDADLYTAISQALKDQGDASYGKYGKGMSARHAVNDMVKRVIENAKESHVMFDQLKKRGIQVEYLTGDSYVASHIKGQHVLSVIDPPYYATKGYNGVNMVPIETYNETRKLLQRVIDAGNSVIYTDEAWFDKGVSQYDKKTKTYGPNHGKTVMPNDLSKKVDGLDAVGQLLTIKDMMDAFFRTPIDGRIETIGLYNGNNKSNISANNIRGTGGQRSDSAQRSKVGRTGDSSIRNSAERLAGLGDGNTRTAAATISEIKFSKSTPNLSDIFKSLGKNSAKPVSPSDTRLNNHPKAELIAAVQNHWQDVLDDHGINKDAGITGKLSNQVEIKC